MENNLNQTPAQEGKTRKPKTEKATATVKDLEKEFGIKAKIIRRYLRKMPESTKPRGPERYEWRTNSPEYKAIHKNLTAKLKKEK